jgi:hypothetical protein
MSNESSNNMENNERNFLQDDSEGSLELDRKEDPA